MSFNKGDFVTVTNKFKTARISFSQGSGQYHVTLVPVLAGVEGMTIRGSSFAAIKDELVRLFGNAAVFSERASVEIDPVQAAQQEAWDNRPPGRMELNGMGVDEVGHAWEILTRAYGQRDAKGRRALAPGQEISWEMAKAQGIRRPVYDAIMAQVEKQFADEVTQHHRALAAGVSREEQLKLSYANFATFATNPAFPQWVQWFKDHMIDGQGFLSFPNKTWANRDTLLKYCEAKGWYVPRHEEIAYAMSAIINADGFYSLPAYKRSQKHLAESVRPITGNESLDVAARFGEQEVAEAATALRKSLPAGTVPNLETVKAVAARLGISDELLEAIRQKNECGPRTEGALVTKPDSQKTTAELKADELARRNAARNGAPISRGSTSLKGYR